MRIDMYNTKYTFKHIRSLIDVKPMKLLKHETRRRGLCRHMEFLIIEGQNHRNNNAILRVHVTYYEIQS